MSYCILLIMLSLLGLSHGGSCPPTLPVDQCDAACGPNTECPEKQLCCPTACGGAMCVDAMTDRHFVDLVKPGLCPEYPRGPWICTHTCTSDSDCPRTLKCCPNRCGAQACQKPDLVLPATGNA
ncbi:waprin-Phi1-like [Trichoplusia ni]|uniref:Waprin-Phi1-like n=1 Tax=Trichoplusia ni TaxID=7111 RepID=A0A7E5W9P3_TRINI|nr:waprin-Phi1-like [Trichoplusia ni]